MQELKFKNLSVEQKIGMVTCGIFAPGRNREHDHSVYELIKNHALGCVWVQHGIEDFEEVMAKLKDTADYPLLIVSDAERGLTPYTIGRSNAIGMTDNEDLAYAFGKVTAVTARKLGYNIICNPVLDMIDGVGICGANSRSIGSDKYKVAKLTAAIARGMHDGGILTVGKHYGSVKKDYLIDSHMAEISSSVTKEEFIDYNLYPYTELMKEGLLDGIMAGHYRLNNIDPDYPASLSKKALGIIRDLGFEGFIISDALPMMGIVAKYGDTDSKGMAVEAGNDIALVWSENNQAGYDNMYNCYKKGIISPERLDAATKKILDAMHKVFVMEPKFTEITEEDKKAISKINTDSVYVKTDEGVPAILPRDARHLFFVLTDNETDIIDGGKVTVDTFSGGWHSPKAIVDKLLELYPNSEAVAIRQFPSQRDNNLAVDKSVKFDDVIFVTFTEGRPYVGREQFTPRIISLIEAMQMTNQVSTIVHYGNPYALEDLPHIPRVIFGTCSKQGVMAALDVLAGNYPPKGKLTYKVDLK